MSNREAAAASERPLQPLPEPRFYSGKGERFGAQVTGYYTAEQMHAYVLADRAASAPPPGELAEIQKLLGDALAQFMALPARGFVAEAAARLRQYSAASAPQAVRMPLTEAERASLDWLRTLATDKAMYQDRLGPIYKLIEGIVPLSPQDTPKEGGK